jgi:hypothetical protein
MTKSRLFRVNTNCSGDGPAIYEFVRYKEEIEKATGKSPVMVGISYYPLFGVVRGIKYILEDKNDKITD